MRRLSSKPLLGPGAEIGNQTVLFGGKHKLLVTMASFVIYLDAPDRSAEPPVDLLDEIQKAVEHLHAEWTVRFDYTRVPSSNASVYVGVSVSGSSADDPSAIIAEVKRMIAEVDKDHRITVARTRHSVWDFG